jgi:hypothetical protein
LNFQTAEVTPVKSPLSKMFKTQQLLPARNLVLNTSSNSISMIESTLKDDEATHLISLKAHRNML